MEAILVHASRLPRTGFAAAPVQAYSLLLLVLLAGALTAGVHAQSYPTKPIRIQTSGAATSLDFTARTLANELSTALGQTVIVENRPQGYVLVTGVATAAPDGYTLLAVGGTLWTAPLFDKAPYDVFRDFAPITTLARSPNILIVHPSLPVRSVAELIKLAKARPGELNGGSASVGSSSDLAGQLFKSMANVDIVTVRYPVGQQLTMGMLSGEIQLTFQGGATWANLVKAGKVRALATGSSKRSVLFPQLPTVAETVPGFVSESLLGFLAPAKTPDAIVKRLNQETVRALEKPQVREHLLTDGLEAAGGTPEELKASITAEVARIAKLLKDVGFKPGG